MPSFHLKSVFYTFGSVTVLKRNSVILLTILRHFLAASKVKSTFLAWFHLWSSTHHMSNTSNHKLVTCFRCQLSGLSLLPFLPPRHWMWKPLNLWSLPHPLLNLANSFGAVDLPHLLPSSFPRQLLSLKSHNELCVFLLEHLPLYRKYYLIIVARIMGLFLTIF